MFGRVDLVRSHQVAQARWSWLAIFAEPGHDGDVAALPDEVLRDAHCFHVTDIVGQHDRSRRHPDTWRKPGHTSWFWARRELDRSGALNLNRHDREPCSCCVGDLADVSRVRRHHGILPSSGAFDDSDVDDVIVTGPCRKCSDGLGLFLGERFGGAQGKEAGQARLAGSAAPGFGEHWGRHGGGDLEREEAGVQCPHPSVVSVGRDQRARVVGNAVHSGGLA